MTDKIFWNTETINKHNKLTKNRLKAGFAGDAVDKNKTGTCAYILATHNGIFFLASSIKNIQHNVGVIKRYLFAVTVFDGGVVLGNEKILGKLDGKGRFPCDERCWVK